MKIELENNEKIANTMLPSVTPQEDPNQPPKTRKVIDRAIDAGAMGVGGLMSIPEAIARLKVTRNIKDV